MRCRLVDEESLMSELEYQQARMNDLLDRIDQRVNEILRLLGEETDDERA